MYDTSGFPPFRYTGQNYRAGAAHLDVQSHWRVAVNAAVGKCFVKIHMKNLRSVFEYIRTRIAQRLRLCRPSVGNAVDCVIKIGSAAVLYSCKAWISVSAACILACGYSFNNDGEGEILIGFVCPQCL